MKPNYFYSLLNKKITSVLILCIAILAKLIQQIYFFVPTLDRACQLVLAKNLLAGNGLTINKVLQDGITQVYTPVSSWPPGYPVLVSLLSFLLHLSVINAAIVFDCISITLILFFSRQILLTANCKLPWVNIYTILIGFFLFDFSELPATDLNALAFYLWSLAISLRIIKKGVIKPLELFLLVFINIIPLSLKYLYAPLIFIQPSYLLWVGIKIHSNNIKKIASRFILGTVVLSIGLFIFQRLYTGNPIYLAQSDSGFFPGNLKYFFYVVISGFTNIVVDYSFLQRFHLIHFGQYYFIIWWTNVILCVILTLYFIKTVFKKSLSGFTLKFHYTTIGSLAGIITVLELVYLSVRYQLKTNAETWTYIQEARYFAFVVVFLQQLAFMYIFDNWASVKRKFIRLTGFILAISFLIEIVHGLYFTIKITSNSKSYFGPENVDARIMESIRNKINEEKRLNPGKKIYFISSEDLYSYAANIEGAFCFYKDHLPINRSALTNSVILEVKKSNEELSGIKLNCHNLNTIEEFELLECGE